jgi:hypothetical protein
LRESTPYGVGSSRGESEKNKAWRPRPRQQIFVFQRSVLNGAQHPSGWECPLSPAGVSRIRTAFQEALGGLN